MNLGRCPICHARLHLDALIQDEAGRELLALLAPMPAGLARALVSYLALFRPRTRDLANDRALRLAREALALDMAANAAAEPLARLALLEAAMAETVEALRGKEGEPLGNHNYLKKVLASLAARQAAAGAAIESGRPADPVQPASKALQSMQYLEQRAASGDWLLRELCQGFMALIPLSLEGRPAADMLPATLDSWYLALKRRSFIEQRDTPRIQEGFVIMAGACRRWPEPGELISRLPQVVEAAAKPLSPEDRETRKKDAQQRVEALKQAIHRRENGSGI